MSNTLRQELNALAYRDCLLWAVTQDDITERFTANTGVKLPLQAKTPLDSMIDKATGADTAFAKAFTEWFNANVWGEADVPVIS